jgi:hypothetical protein
VEIRFGDRDLPQYAKRPARVGSGRNLRIAKRLEVDVAARELGDAEHLDGEVGLAVAVGVALQLEVLVPQLAIEPERMYRSGLSHRRPDTRSREARM